MSEITLDTQSLSELLKSTNLVIPPYQRPYSWTEKQLMPLLNDLAKMRKEDIMIMGTIILHKEENKEKQREGEEKREFVLNIVDGQQRLITFSIIQYLLTNEQLLSGSLLSQNISHRESKINIQNNAIVIKDWLDRKNLRGSLSFDNIHFIIVQTGKLDNAFAFFDSQNTRGKKLEDYDILKAHHLRYIKSYDLATICAKEWEKTEKDENIGLNLLLNTLLARGRSWSKGNNGIPNIREEFKSQRTAKKEAKYYLLNRYQQPALFHAWKYNPVESSSLSFQFKSIDAIYKVGGIEVSTKVFEYLPFQITQTIEGGEIFFWYTQKYHRLAKKLFDINNRETSDDFKALLERLNVYRYNTGCSYILDVYKGALLFYFDEFEYEGLDEITAKLFYVLFWLRMKQQTVRYSSIYKFIREEFNPFSLINEASFPDYIFRKCDEYLEGCYRNFDKDKGFRKDFYNGIFAPNNLKLLSRYYSIT